MHHLKLRPVIWSETWRLTWVKNIRVNGIAPGAILTDALKSVITPEIEQKMLQHTPIRRLGQPQDIANAALFLCSPAASWVSGQILTVSGGGVQELN